jgi:hypothetical protein
MRPFIPKQDPEMPDHYGIEVHYLDGKMEEFEIVNHNLGDKHGVMSMLTKDDQVQWIPMISVKRVLFDKRFTKVMEIRRKQEEEAERQKEMNKEK